MHKLLRIIAWTCLFIVFIASIIFSYANTQSVSLSFGFTTLAPQPLALWVISAFVLGAICGLLLGLGLWRGVRTRLEMRRLRARLDKAEQALQQSKAAQQDALEN